MELGSFYDRVSIKNGEYKTENIQRLMCSKFATVILKAYFYNFENYTDELSVIPKSTYSKKIKEFLEYEILEKRGERIEITDFGKDLLYIYGRIATYLAETLKLKDEVQIREYLNMYLGSKWKARVIWYIYLCPCARFNEMCRSIEGISHKVLTDSLEELEANGIIRKMFSYEKMPKSEYELTSLGNEIAKFIIEIGFCCKRYNVVTQKVTITVE